MAVYSKQYAAVKVERKQTPTQQQSFVALFTHVSVVNLIISLMFLPTWSLEIVSFLYCLHAGFSVVKTQRMPIRVDDLWTAPAFTF